MSSRQPGLGRLIQALTADGDPEELADRETALAMFRAVRRRRHRYLRFSIRVSVAAGIAAMCAGFTAAAYAAVLPPPIQHFAHTVLARFGVPENHSSVSSALVGQRRLPAGHGIISPNAAPAYPSIAGSAWTPGRALAFTVARTRVAAGENDAFWGRLTDHGESVPGVQVRLLEQAAGQTGWRLAVTGMTSRHGDVTLTVRNLTRNARFRIVARDAASSATVTVTVIPSVLLRLAPSTQGTDLLVASARFGDTGDVMVLRKLSGGVWQEVATREIGSGLLADFSIPAGSPTARVYRVELLETDAHGQATSAPVRLPATAAGGLPAPALILFWRAGI